MNLFCMGGPGGGLPSPPHTPARNMAESHVKKQLKRLWRAWLRVQALDGVLVTQVFSLDENRAVDQFGALMEQVATESGARYIRVPWSKEHMQNPEKN